MPAQVSKKHSGAQRPKPSRAGERVLARGALRLLLWALGCRLLTYHAVQYTKHAAPAVMKVLSPVGHAAGLLQVVATTAALASNSLRHTHGTALMYSLAVLAGLSAGVSSPRPGGKASRFGEPLPGGLLPMLYSLTPEELFTVSLDTRPLLFAALPAALLVYLLLSPVGPPGRSLLAVITAGLTPYAVVQVSHLIPKGWAGAAAAAAWVPTIGAVVAGVYSCMGAWWAIATAHKLARGRSMTGGPIQLRDPLKGSEPADQRYVAASTLVHTLLMPLWLLIYAARTWLWLLSCGVAFRQQA